MRPLPLTPFARRSPRALVAALLAVAALARAQGTPGSTDWPGWNPYGQQPSAPQQAPAPAAPKPAAASPAIARVGGRAITQDMYDRLANAYFPRVRAQMGSLLTPEVMKQARQNVFDELVRREIILLEAQRLGVSVSEAETDAMLERDPMLQTNGRFDPAKLQQFKLAPQSNYRQILPALRDMALQKKADEAVRARFAPPRDSVRREYDRRESSAEFRYLLLAEREVTLDPESSESEWRAYHAGHASEFTQRSKLRLRYRRWPLPPAGDSTAAAAESLAMSAARLTADSLRSRALADTTRELLDTGLFEPAAFNVPGFGRGGVVATAAAKADTVSSERVLGPLRTNDAIVVAVVAERVAKRQQPFREVMADARRRADAEKRRQHEEQLRRDWYAANTNRFRGARLKLSRITLRLDGYVDTPKPDAEMERWYRANGRKLFGLPDTSHAWLPPMNDSLRRVVRQARYEEDRSAWLAERSAKLAAEYAKARDAAAAARVLGARAETLSLSRTSPPDSLFTGVLLDTLLATGAARKGVVQGPQGIGSYLVAWRVESADTGFVPAFEAARGRLESAYLEAKRATDDADARTWFDAYRDRYTTPERVIAEFVQVPLPATDTMKVSEATLRASYDKNLDKYKEPEQVKARHLLISARGVPPEQELRAKQRADSLLAALKAGADFAELAKKFSQDPGSGAAGGDLGWFGRGRMVPEFEKAAFELKPGELSGVVKTAFGFHILKLDEKKAAGVKSFASVRNEIRNSITAARADTLARRAAESLRRQALRGGDVAKLAAAYGGLRTTAPFAPNETVGSLGVVAGLGDDLPVTKTGSWTPRAYRAGSGYVVMRVKQRVAPGPAEFSEVRARALEDLRASQRRERLVARAGAIRAALAAGATLDSVAMPWGGLKDSGPVKRAFGFVPGLGAEPRVMDAVFHAAPGFTSDTLHVAQGVAWFRLEKREATTDAAFAAAQAALSQELAKKAEDVWLAEKKKALGLVVLKSEFRGGAK